MRARGFLAGAAVASLLALAGTVQIVTAAGGSRTISLLNIHTGETLEVLFKKDGKYIESAMQQINHLMRDHRANQATKMDTDLIDLIWEVHQEVGSKKPVHIISGYRSRASNDLLRRTVGGQASESRHILGKAADVHFPDVEPRNLRYSAILRQRGGVGYYPTSAMPFVHLDTDRVRAWPRLPRLELALLFPDGVTRHVPADGGPLTKDDARIARARHPELANQIAELRTPGARPPVAVAVKQPQPDRPAKLEVAVLTPPAPTLVRVGLHRTLDQQAMVAFLEREVGDAMPPPPKQIRAGMMPPSITGGPPVTKQAAPPPPKPATRLAAFTPPTPVDGPVNDAGRFSPRWSPNPTFDDEHPEELAYHPFLPAAYLTDKPEDPLMSELLPHDVARTVDFIDKPSTIAPLRFRADAQTVRRLWAQQFTGEAVGIEKLRAAQAGRPPAPSGIHNRPVRTSEK